MNPDLADFLVEFPIILLLTLANGMFALAEMALIMARKARLQKRALEGDKGARTALVLTDQPDRFLSTVQVGITLIATMSSAFAGASLVDEVGTAIYWSIPVLQPYAREIALVVVVLFVTYISLVFGELLPKRLAMSNPERIAAIVAAPMLAFQKIASPVVKFLTFSTDVMMRVLGVKKNADPPVSEEEVRSMLHTGKEVGIFEQQETEMVESVFRLGDRDVGALMTPRVNIVWINASLSYEENYEKVRDSSHTYFPMAEDNLDNVIGLISLKDFLMRGRDMPLHELTRPVLFIPESTAAFKSLELLRGGFGNSGLVIDEWGGVLGMVTLFDVLESIMGSISQGGMPLTPLIIKREDGSWLIDGEINIDLFKDTFGISTLPDEDRAGYQTLAGFILSCIGSIPMAGDHFDSGGYRYEVVDMDGLRVDKVLVTKI